MKKVIVLMNTANGEVLGHYNEDQKLYARIRAKELGANFQAIACEMGEDGKPKLPALHLQAGPSGEPALAERTRCLGLLSAFGIWGFVRVAVETGMSGEQARQLFKGKSETELWGPMGRPGGGVPQDNSLAEWDSAAVRAEFGGDRELFLIYKGAEAKGLIH